MKSSLHWTCYLPGFNPDSSLAIEAIQNQGVVGRVLTRHVGLKPDLRSNEQSGLNLQCVAVKRALSCYVAMKPGSFDAFKSNVAVARHPSRRFFAPIRQSAKSAVDSFQMKMASSIAGSSSN